MDGTHDTERPPARPPEQAGEERAPFVGATTPNPAEATTVGPPPDPARTMTHRVGPPTPQAFRAAEPAAPPAATRAAPGAGARPRTCAKCGASYPPDFLVCPRDATPLTAASAPEADPLLGQIVDETFRIVRLVGEGGMGRVYEARHLRLRERRFAIKCLHADLARNAEMAARFLREASSASSIKHENVIDVIDVHHLPDGTPYLVGEFLEGEELAQYVTRRGPLEPRLAAKVARQIGSALAAAHARGIVHRDVKPENVFVLGASIAALERGESSTLRVKVLDFGISTAGADDRSHLTRTGVIMGTPSYMAPEQARGRPVDHRADVYSLGACLYFMVTGRRPFDSEDPSSTLAMVLTEDPARPRSVDPRIPEVLELVIQRAMAKDASDRYGSMAEVDKALASFLGTSSTRPPAASQLDLAKAVDASGARANTVRLVEIAKALVSPKRSAAAHAPNLARYARPLIVVVSAVLGAWLVGGMVAALTGLIRLLRGGDITPMESFLLVMACVFASATPVALYVVNVRKVIWPNSVRAVQLASDLQRTTLSALVTYGVLSMFARLVHTVLLRSSQGLGSGAWDIALFFASIGAALAFGNLRMIVKNLRRGRLD